MKKLLTACFFALAIAIFLAATPQYQVGNRPFKPVSYTPPPSVFPAPLARWLLNEGGSATVALDSSGNGKYGNWGGTKSCSGSYYTTGYPPLAYTGCFNGNDNYITITSAFPFDGTTPFSTCSWMSSGDTTSPLKIIFSNLVGGGPSGWEFGTSNGKLVFGIYNAYPSNYLQVTGNTNAATTSWNLVCATYDGSRSTSGVNLYINGVQDTKNVTSNTLTSSAAQSTPLQIGERPTSTLYAFGGYLEDAQIYNTELTPSQVAALYGVGPGGTPGTGVSYAHNGCNSSTVTSDSVTCTVSGVTAGQSILVSSVFLVFGNIAASTLTDTGTGFVTTIQPQRYYSGTDWMRQEYLISNASAGTHTITISSPISAHGYGSIVASIFNNVASAYSISNQEELNVTATSSCNPVTTRTPNDFIVGVMATNQVSVDITAGTAPQAMTLGDSTSPAYHAFQYGTAPTAGSNYAQYGVVGNTYCDLFALSPSTGGDYIVVHDDFAYSTGCHLDSRWTDELSQLIYTTTCVDIPTFSSNGNANALAYWSANSFSAFPNQYSQSQIYALATGGSAAFLGVAVREQPSGAGYICMIQNSGSSISTYLYSCPTISTCATVGTTYTGGFSNGDLIAAKAYGTQISCEKNGYTIIGPVTDTNSSGGQPGIYSYGIGYGGAARGVYWEGGSLQTNVNIPPPTALYTLCGETSTTSGCQGSNNSTAAYQVYDTSGNNQTAVWQNGAASFSPGTNVPYIAAFATNYGVNAGGITSTSLPPPFSMCFWQYPTVNTGTPLPLAFLSGPNGNSFDGWFIQLVPTATGLVAVSGANFGTATGVNGPASPLNAWTHVCFEVSPTTLYLYINGTLAGSAASTVMPGSPANLNIGAWGVGHGFTGYISHVSVYNTLLTPAQIQQLYSRKEY